MNASLVITDVRKLAKILGEDSSVLAKQDCVLQRTEKTAKVKHLLFVFVVILSSLQSS